MLIKGQIELASGDVLLPHTTSDVVFDAEGVAIEDAINALKAKTGVTTQVKDDLNFVNAIQALTGKELIIGAKTTAEINGTEESFGYQLYGTPEQVFLIAKNKSNMYMATYDAANSGLIWQAIGTGASNGDQEGGASTEQLLALQAQISQLQNETQYNEIGLATDFPSDHPSKINFRIASANVSETWSSNIKLGDLETHTADTGAHQDIRDLIDRSTFSIGEIIADRSKYNFIITEENTETAFDASSVALHNNNAASHADMRETMLTLTQDATSLQQQLTALDESKADVTTTDSLAEQIDVLEERMGGFKLYNNLVLIGCDINSTMIDIAENMIDQSVLIADIYSPQELENYPSRGGILIVRRITNNRAEFSYYDYLTEKYQGYWDATVFSGWEKVATTKKTEILASYFRNGWVGHSSWGGYIVKNGNTATVSVRLKNEVSQQAYTSVMQLPFTCPEAIPVIFSRGDYTSSCLGVVNQSGMLQFAVGTNANEEYSATFNIIIN